MSLQDSIQSVNHNRFIDDRSFEPSFDDLSQTLDSRYSPGILETEMLSNRSSVYSDILSLNEKSLDYSSNRDSLKNNLNMDLNHEDVDQNNTKTELDDSTSSASHHENNVDGNLKQPASSTLEAAALVDVDGISLDDDVAWLSSKKPSHAVSSNALNLLKDDSGDKKSSSKLNHVNSSPLKRYSSGKIEKFGDFGQVTEIIGVPPLSASNKDLSSIGKELSLNKQQVYENADPNQPSLSASNSKFNFGSGYVLADLNDVQNVAKLQEQSLRMSFSTPLVNKNMALKASNKKLNETGSQAKSKSKTTLTGKAGGPGVARSPARNSVPLSQFNSNSISRKNPNEPFQKSLPNLARKLQPAKGPTMTGGRSQRSVLPQSGPPVRTASQPAVASQIKPFQRNQPQRTTSTQLKPQGMSLNQRNVNIVKKTSARAPPTSLNASSRGPPSNRQPLSTRQPLNTTGRQPLNTTGRQPLNATGRQPLNATGRQPLNTSRQPASASRQPLSTTTRQLPSSQNRAPMGGRTAVNTTSRTNTSRLASGTRTPLNAPPIRSVNTTQARTRTAAPSATSRNPSSLLNRTNLSSATNRTTLTSNRNNTSITRGTASTTRNNPQTNPMASRTRPVSNLNNTGYSSRLNTTNRPLPASSAAPLRNPSARAPTTNKPISSVRSNTPRNPSNFNQGRLAKPSAVLPTNRRTNDVETEDWKDGCF